MIKNTGKVHARAAEHLARLGVDTSTLQVATLGRGTDHLVLLNGETIGEYNHVSGHLVLYAEPSDDTPEG